MTSYCELHSEWWGGGIPKGGEEARVQAWPLLVGPLRGRISADTCTTLSPVCCVVSGRLFVFVRGISAFFCCGLGTLLADFPSQKEKQRWGFFVVPCPMSEEADVLLKHVLMSTYGIAHGT